LDATTEKEILERKARHDLQKRKEKERMERERIADAVVAQQLKYQPPQQPPQQPMPPPTSTKSSKDKHHQSSSSRESRSSSKETSEGKRERSQDSLGLEEKGRKKPAVKPANTPKSRQDRMTQDIMDYETQENVD
jgi:hypothetical protein